MKIKAENYIEEAIKLEIMMHEVYTLFQNMFPEDEIFWKQIASEELKHAEIVRKLKAFLPFDPDLTKKLFLASIDSMKNTIIELQKIIADFKGSVTRKDAFRKALKIENNACEIHYQALLVEEKKSKVHQIFQLLNGNDKDHVQRIRQYMAESNIK